MTHYCDLTDIRSIQLDHTSRCNLACPQCPRTPNDWNKDRVIPPNNLDLTVEDYERIFAPLIPNADKTRILHVGNYGDALASPTFTETLDWCKQYPWPVIQVHTNGSLRTPDYYEYLARQQVRLVFAIDGLEDTNHIYRVNSNWDRLWNNVLAFIRAGGSASWDYLEFEHNAHQTETARELAARTGFTRFNVKQTPRFAASNRTQQIIQTKKQTYTIKDTPRSKPQQVAQQIIKQWGTKEQFQRQASVRCKTVRLRNFFVDFNCTVYPCCWLANEPYRYKSNPGKRSILFQQYSNTDPHWNSLRHHTWEEILAHDFYSKDLINSWDNPDTRIVTCSNECGVKP